MVFGGDSDEDKFGNDHRRAPDDNHENAGAPSGKRLRQKSEEAGDKHGEEGGGTRRNASQIR